MYRSTPSKRRRSRSRDSHELRNPSPSRQDTIRTNIDLSEITSQLLLDNKINLSDYLATKASGKIVFQTISCSKFNL